MNRMLTHILSFTLALFVTSGALRSILGIGEALYILSMGSLGMVWFLKVYQNNGKVKWSKELSIYIFLIFLLFSLLLFSVMWTHSVSQYKKDMLMLILNFLLAFFTAMTLEENVKKLFGNYLAGICAGVALFTIVQSGGIIGVTGYGTRVGELYLTLGASIAIGLICSMVNFLVAENKRWLWAALSAVFIMGLGLTLARGALVFSLAVVVVAIFFVFKLESGKLITNRSVLRRYMTFVSPGVFAALGLALSVKRTRLRLLRMLAVREELATGGRGLLWYTAWHNIMKKPFVGYGLGSNGIFSGEGEANYPHNLFLQVWLDAGLLAAVLLFLVALYPIVIYLIKSSKDLTLRYSNLVFFSCYLFLLLEYSKSSNFYTARGFFLFGVILVWSSTLGRKEPEHLEQESLESCQGG